MQVAQGLLADLGASSFGAHAHASMRTAKVILAAVVAGFLVGGYVPPIRPSVLCSLR